MAFTPRGIQKPDGSTPISIFTLLGALADTADAAIDALETSLRAWVAGRTRAGQAAVSLAAASTGTVDVTFSTPFDSVPRVVATSASALYYATVHSISTSGCVIRVRHVEGTTATTTVSTQWIAAVSS